jgi:hypothetical protein
MRGPLYRRRLSLCSCTSLVYELWVILIGLSKILTGLGKSLCQFDGDLDSLLRTGSNAMVHPF